MWMNFVDIVLVCLAWSVLVCMRQVFANLEFSFCQTGMGFERYNAGVVGQVDELEEVASWFYEQMVYGLL